MKRILTLILSVTLILGSFALSAFAAEKPAGAAEGSNVSELTSSTTAPDMTKLISQGLSASQNCSVKGLLDSSWKTVDIAENILPDIGNHFKYGFSVLGAGRLQKYPSSAVDGVWSTGNYGSKVESGMAGQGAFTWYMNDSIYNKNGESVQIESEDAYKNGYIYEMLMTFNFGCIAELDSFAFVTTSLAGMNQSADIYVSNNGKDWTLVGYFDRNQMLLDGEDLNKIGGSALGADKSGGTFTDTNGFAVSFELPEGTKGQFLRIAATSGNAVNSNPSEYGSNLREWDDYNENNYQTFRELMVFGKLTTDVGYTYQEGDGEPTTDTNDTNDTTGTEETTAPTVNVKPKDTDDETTVANVTTAAGTESSTDDNTATTNSGCGSTVGMSFAVIATITAGALTVVKRRKKD